MLTMPRPRCPEGIAGVGRPSVLCGFPMTHRSCRLWVFGVPLLVSLTLPATSFGQKDIYVGGGVGVPGFGPGGWTSLDGSTPPKNWSAVNGLTSPWWGYPGLGGGPFLTYGYPYLPWPGYRAANGPFWTNGLSLYGPPVPVYGPIPGVLGASDFSRQWKEHPSLGWGTGWVGVYAASPRPRPASVGTWSPSDPRGLQKHPGLRPGVPGAAIEGAPGPGSGVGVSPGGGGGCLVLSVKVPQPAAEVTVDGVKMTQGGTDRLFESPPLEAGKEYQYELTARWLERGAVVERKKVVTGKPGEVVRVDFDQPDTAPVTMGK